MLVPDIRAVPPPNRVDRIPTETRASGAIEATAGSVASAFNLDSGISPAHP